MKEQQSFEIPQLPAPYVEIPPIFHTPSYQILNSGIPMTSNKPIQLDAADYKQSPIQPEKVIEQASPVLTTPLSPPISTPTTFSESPTPLVGQEGSDVIAATASTPRLMSPKSKLPNITGLVGTLRRKKDADIKIEIVSKNEADPEARKNRKRPSGIINRKSVRPSFGRMSTVGWEGVVPSRESRSNSTSEIRQDVVDTDIPVEEGNSFDAKEFLVKEEVAVKEKQQEAASSTEPPAVEDISLELSSKSKSTPVLASPKLGLSTVKGLMGTLRRKKQAEMKIEIVCKDSPLDPEARRQRRRPSGLRNRMSARPSFGRLSTFREDRADSTMVEGKSEGQFIIPDVFKVPLPELDNDSLDGVEATKEDAHSVSEPEDIDYLFEDDPTEAVKRGKVRKRVLGQGKQKTLRSIQQETLHRDRSSPRQETNEHTRRIIPTRPAQSLYSLFGKSNAQVGSFVSPPENINSIEFVNERIRHLRSGGAELNRVRSRTASSASVQRRLDF